VCDAIGAQAGQVERRIIVNQSPVFRAKEDALAQAEIRAPAVDRGSQRLRRGARAACRVENQAANTGLDKRSKPPHRVPVNMGTRDQLYLD
jgi:hypothetical protein